jgi:hypothetical protein
MTKSLKNRFARLVLFAALALMFWLFDLTFLAWMFGAMVILPFIGGAIIWMFKSIKNR